MKKKAMPVIVAVIFIVVIGLIAVCSAIIERLIPSKERVDLNEYYGVAAEDDLAVVLDCEQSELTGKLIDGQAYLNYKLVHDKLNQRFYWDENENILRYTTPTDVISVDSGSSDYYMTREKNSVDYVIVRSDGDTVYLAIDFVQMYTNIEYTMESDPNRVIITSVWGDVQTAKVKGDTQIRKLGGIKSPIVADVEKGDSVTVIESMENWSKVITADGMIGYIRNRKLGSTETVTTSREFEEPQFSHLCRDKMINMVWHQVTNQDTNGQISNVLRTTKGVNVISPTWFYLNDNNGNLHSLASKDYVTYCHNAGIEVWALVSNLENEDVDTTTVLTHSSIRDNLTNQIVAAAIEYNLDGINLDFESLSGVGDAYIQFIRELSIKCEKNGIVLSVDNYVPSSYTAFYNRAEQAVFADYIVIMGYDEHYAGCEEEGSVASIGFVTKGVEDTLLEVPAEQIILGMPFYTRVWECTPTEDVTGSTEQSGEEDASYTISSVAVGMQEAEKRVSVNGAEKVWSEEDGQYYAEYENDGKTYKIWLEDESSMELRLKLMKEKNLAGASFWKLGLEKNSIWDTIIKYIN